MDFYDFGVEVEAGIVCEVVKGAGGPSSALAAGLTVVGRVTVPALEAAVLWLLPDSGRTCC